MNENLNSGAAMDDKKLIRRARERLLYCLDRRLHSEKELRQKLFGKYPPHIIDAAIDEIASLGLIDDLKFALAFAEHRKTVQKKGPYKVKQELFAKGVCKDVIDEAIESVFSSEDEEITAALAIGEKYRDELCDEKGRQRLFNALVRKGFSFATAKAVIRQMCEIQIEED